MAIVSANGAATPLSPNYIINGAFDFWQRGTSFSTDYTADRWYLSAGSNTSTISRQTFTPGSAPVSGNESTYFARYTRTSTSSDAYFLQRVEDARTLGGKTFTLSFWAKASANTTISQIYTATNLGTGGAGSGGAGGNFSGRAITTSWQRYTEVITMPSLSGTTIGTNSFTEVVFKLGSEMGNITLDLWGVQIENGSVATPFRRNANSLQGELAACQRYFERLDGSNSFAGIALAVGATSTALYKAVIPMKVSKRIAPSVSFLNLVAYDGSSNWTITSANSLSTKDVASADFGLTGASITVNRMYIIGTSNPSSGYLDLNAEL